MKIQKKKKILGGGVGRGSGLGGSGWGCQVGWERRIEAGGGASGWGGQGGCEQRSKVFVKIQKKKIDGGGGGGGGGGGPIRGWGGEVG